jgi:ABC-type lipoprotein release transport system permease subunit
MGKLSYGMLLEMMLVGIVIGIVLSVVAAIGPAYRAASLPAAAALRVEI